MAEGWGHDLLAVSPVETAICFEVQCKLFTSLDYDR